MDLCVLIDSSGRVRDMNPPDGSYDNWNLQLELLSVLVGGFSISDDFTRVAALVFSDRAELLFPLNLYDRTTDVQTAIRGAQYIGNPSVSANISHAFSKARTECFSVDKGDRPNVDNVLIILTTGVTADRDRAMVEADALKRGGVHVIPIGVSDVIDMGFLRNISMPPHRENLNFYAATNFVVLGFIQEQLVKQTCDIITGILSC